MAGSTDYGIFTRFYKFYEFSKYRYIATKSNYYSFLFIRSNSLDSDDSVLRLQQFYIDMLQSFSSILLKTTAICREGAIKKE